MRAFIMAWNVVGRIGGSVFVNGGESWDEECC